MTDRIKKKLVALGGGVTIEMASKGYDLGLRHGAIEMLRVVESLGDALAIGEKGEMFKRSLRILSDEQAEKAHALEVELRA